MPITKEEAFQHSLCMSLQGDNFSYAVLAPDKKRIVQSERIALEEFSREHVQSHLTDDLLGYDFGSIIATAGGKRNTLMPVDLFNNSKAEDIFRLNYSEPIDNLDYNRIPELGIVNIYELPLWMKSLFVIKFPRVKLIHPSTVLLKGVFNQSTWGAKAHVYVAHECFYLVITAKGKLQYFNCFDFTTIEDMVYHILFVLEQKEMDPASIDLNMYGVSTSWEQLDKFKSFFKNPVKLSSEKEQSEHFILANQILCV